MRPRRNQPRPRQCLVHVFQLTHKIDPAIDGEREYVNETLSGTGLVKARAHVTPATPLTTAKTATGGEFHSDGRILVLMLKDNTTKN